MRVMRNSDRMKSGLTDLCKRIPSKAFGIEIGSFAGESAEIIMSSGRVQRLWCVDPWECDGKFGEDLKLAEARFDQVAAKYPGIVKCKGVLSRFRRHIPPCNFIYIDGDHAFGAALRDICQSLMFVKKPCLIAGHDYTSAHMGVVNAVNMVFSRDKLRLYQDGSWSFFIGANDPLPI
jgi:hypothetical protein